MTNSFVACALALTVTAAVPALVSSQGQKPTDSVALATITKLEHEAIKAVLANDSSFFEKFLADDYTGGTSRGTWDTKPSILADMKDVKNNKTKSQNLTDLKVRVHGDLAVATYRSTYDAMIQRKAVRQNSPVHGRAPTAERRLEADGEPLLSSRQIGSDDFGRVLAGNCDASGVGVTTADSSDTSFARFSSFHTRSRQNGWMGVARQAHRRP